MAGSLIAALAAFFASLFAFASPSGVSEETATAPLQGERATIEASVEDLRAQIRGFVEDTLTRAGIDAASVPPETAEGEASITPLPQAQEPADSEGCDTKESMGPGWARSLVRCVQRSADGSVSNLNVSSSSSVNVPGTNSDDVP